MDGEKYLSVKVITYSWVRGPALEIKFRGE